jgi:hypothetical protein
MCVISEMSLCDQSGYLLGSEAVAGPHGSVTGHQTQQIVEELFPGWRLLLSNEVIHYGTQKRSWRSFAQQSRIAVEENGAAAKRGDLKPKLGQLVALLQRAGRLIRRQINQLGNQQALRLQAPLTDAPLELFEHDALVKGMLVDDEHPSHGFQHKVRVVKLDRLFAGRRGGGCAWIDCGAVGLSWSG